MYVQLDRISAMLDRGGRLTVASPRPGRIQCEITHGDKAIYKIQGLTFIDALRNMNAQLEKDGTR